MIVMVVNVSVMVVAAVNMIVTVVNVIVMVVVVMVNSDGGDGEGGNCSIALVE